MNKALIEAATVIGLALEAGNAHDADKPKGRKPLGLMSPSNAS